MSTCGNSSMTVVLGPQRKSFSATISRRTMASLIESPQVALVPVPKLPLPATSPFSFSRLIVPFLGVAIGVSVGSTAGLALALVNAPNNTVAASSDSAQANPASTVAATSVAMNAQPAPVVQPAADTVQSVANSADRECACAEHGTDCSEQNARRREACNLSAGREGMACCEANRDSRCQTRSARIGQRPGGCLNCFGWRSIRP